MTLKLIQWSLFNWFLFTYPGDREIFELVWNHVSGQMNETSTFLLAFVCLLFGAGRVAHSRFFSKSFFAEKQLLSETKITRGPGVQARDWPKTRISNEVMSNTNYKTKQREKIQGECQLWEGRDGGCVLHYSLIFCPSSSMHDGKSFIPWTLASEILGAGPLVVRPPALWNSLSAEIRNAPYLDT